MPTIGHDADNKPVTIDPQRLISTRMLVQANSGGGKSWMLRVLCERLGRSTPLIVLDWEGEFASLREKLDVLLVGREGEIPTAVATAGALATQILEIGVSAVIDLYDLNPTEKRAYVRRFIESLMSAPKRLWSPRLIVVDEAHSLAPEVGDAESAEAVKSLASAGRKRQFCAVLATQRLSKLHKDAAAECNNVLIGRTTLDVDQKRAGDVLGMGRPDFTKLRELREGQFFGFGPALNFDGVRMFKSVEVETTHGDKPGTNAKPPEPSARMNRAVEQLRDLAERSKTEVLDLDSARATIKALRREVAAKVVPVSPKVEGQASALRELKSNNNALRKAMEELMRFVVNIETRDFKDADAAELKTAINAAVESAMRRVEALSAGRAGEIAKLKSDAAKLLYRVKAIADTPTDVVVDVAVTKAAPFTVNQRPTKTPARVFDASGPTDASLPKGERAVLVALAMYPDGLERDELTVLTGYKRSTRDAYVQRLGEKGYATVNSRVVATDAGVSALGDFEPLPTGDALLVWWNERLPEGERKVLNSLARAWPQTVERDHITNETGYKRSTRDAYLQRLGRKRLVEVTSSGVKAADSLFDSGIAA